MWHCHFAARFSKGGAIPPPPPYKQVYCRAQQRTQNQTTVEPQVGRKVRAQQASDPGTPAGMHWNEGGYPPPPPRRPAYAQPLPP